MARGDWLGAIAVLERDILTHPSDPWSRMFLGSCNYELHRYELALEHFCAAEKLAPDLNTPIGLQADTLHAMGEREKAGELYRKALDMDPDDELAKKNMAWWSSESAYRRPC